MLNSMHYPSMILVLLLAFSAQVYGSYWDTPWSAVHDRPVFRIEPSVKWNFTHHPSQEFSSVSFRAARIVINDDTGDMLLPSGGQSPMFFIINKHGQEAFSWNATFSPRALCTGMITHRHSVVYMFSDITCELFAVSVPSGELLWNLTQPELCPEYELGDIAVTPITWLHNDTVMLIVTSRRIVTVRASDGKILMSYGPLLVPNTLVPPMPSRIDDKFIFHISNDTVMKLDVETGQVDWSTQLMPGKYSDKQPPPAIDEDGSIYVPSYGGEVYKLYANGTVAWVRVPQVGELAHFHSAPLLINSTHMLVHTGYQNVAIFVITTADGQVTQLYLNINEVIMSQVYWHKNVLYMISTTGQLGAWDTTDLTALMFLWHIDLQTSIGHSSGAGPSIMKDGTIIVASSQSSAAPVSLMSIGCPNGLHISSDGTECLCDNGTELKNNTCMQCPANQFANDTTNGCRVCYAGTVPNDDQSGCTSCPLNTFSRDGDATCRLCSEEPSNEQCIVTPVTEPVSAQPVAAPTKSPTSRTTSAAFRSFVSPLIITLVVSLHFIA